MARHERLWVFAFAIFAFVLRLPLAFRSPSELAQTYGDDAFYVLSVARNLAAGLGLTVDGHHLANGFQPLITLLYVPFFWLCGSDPWLAVRWTIVLNGFIAAASVIAVAGVARALGPRTPDPGPRTPVLGPRIPAPAIIAAFLWACSISLFHQTTNGLETGLYSLLLLLAISLFLKTTEWTRWTQWAGLGVVLGLTVLARIDAAILVAILAIGWIAKGRYLPAVVSGGVALLVSSPWWIYNLAAFGSLMPTSGQAENAWPTTMHEQLYRLTETLDDIALVLFNTPHDLSFTLHLLTGIAIALLFYALARKSGIARRVWKETRVRELLPFALFSLILVIYYTFFLKAPHFIIRYLQPLRILWLLVVAIAVPIAIESYSQFGRIRRRVTGIAIGSFLLFSIGFGVDRYVAFYHNTDGGEFYNMGTWAVAHPSDKIGMLQSGIASFVAPNVINLDGKVNAEALTAHQQGQLAQYIRNERFTNIADWKPFIEDIAEMCRKDELFFDSVGMVGRIQVMKLRLRSLPASRLAPSLGTIPQGE